jgi:hypothetical protein
LPSDALIIDDPWESFGGSGIARKDAFPNFEEDLKYIKSKGMEIGLWQPLGWVQSPAEAGLEDCDLLCGADGKPRLSNWLQDPRVPAEKSYFCLDPSSEGARRFLSERTKRIVREYGASLLKLDFGYGLPGPDVCSPRDASLRGEKLCAALMRIVGEAAMEEYAGITILYYGISPLLRGLCNMISLDDMGDCGDSPEYERLGHSQRLVWASLAAPHGMPANASSGYYWDSFEDIILDSIVLGTCGNVLPIVDQRGKTFTQSSLARWLAVQKWRRRRSSVWTPLFLESGMGGRGSEPFIRSWARVEDCGICAAALREGSDIRLRGLEGIQFCGKWGIVSLGKGDIYHCGEISVIPFAPGWISFEGNFASLDMVLADGRRRRLDAGDDARIEASRADLDSLMGFVLTRQTGRSC